MINLNQVNGVSKSDLKCKERKRKYNFFLFYDHKIQYQYELIHDKKNLMTCWILLGKCSMSKKIFKKYKEKKTFKSSGKVWYSDVLC